MATLWDKKTTGIDISRRGFIGAAGGGTLLGALALAGCAPSGSGSATATWLNDEGDPGTVKVLNKIVSRYNKASGNKLTIEAVASNLDIYSDELKRIKAGRPNDLANATYAYSAGWAQQGYLRKLDGIIEEQGGVDAFVNDSLFKVGGGYTMMPVDSPVYMLNYRGDWMTAIGEEIPRTWDDFLRVCQKLSAKYGAALIQPMSTGQGATTTALGMNILWSNNVEFFDKDGKVILDEGKYKSRAVEVLDFMKKLAPYMAKGMASIDVGACITTFLNGKVAISPYSGRLLSNAAVNVPEIAKSIVMEGFPTPSGEKLAVSVDPEGVAVLKPGANADVAEDFVGWFLKNGVIDFLHAVPLHLLPAEKATYKDPRWLDNEQIQTYKTQVDKMLEAQTSDSYIRNGLNLMTPGPGEIKSKMFAADVIPEMYQKVVIGGEPASQAVDETADAIRKLQES